LIYVFSIADYHHQSCSTRYLQIQAKASSSSSSSVLLTRDSGQRARRSWHNPCELVQRSTVAVHSPHPSIFPQLGLRLPRRQYQMNRNRPALLLQPAVDCSGFSCYRSDSRSVCLILMACCANGYKPTVASLPPFYPRRYKGVTEV
jgi:hypothetical protein